MLSSRTLIDRCSKNASSWPVFTHTRTGAGPCELSGRRDPVDKVTHGRLERPHAEAPPSTGTVWHCSAPIQLIASRAGTVPSRPFAAWFVPWRFDTSSALPHPRVTDSAPSPAHDPVSPECSTGAGKSITDPSPLIRPALRPNTPSASLFLTLRQNHTKSFRSPYQASQHTFTHFYSYFLSIE